MYRSSCCSWFLWKYIKGSDIWSRLWFLDFMSLILDKLDVHTGLVYAMQDTVDRAGVAEEYNVLPCLGLLPAPGCQEPWNPLGTGWAGLWWIWKGASHRILHQRQVTPGWRLRWISQWDGMGEPDSRICALRTPTFGKGCKVSTSLSHTTTLLSLKGALAWNNFSYTFFFLFKKFLNVSACMQQKLFSALCRCFRFS